MLQFELNPSSQKSCAFKQPANQRVDSIFQDAAKAFRYARVFVCELPRLLVEQLKFPIIKIEKFSVHSTFTRD
jgi:hypothetical protein